MAEVSYQGWGSRLVGAVGGAVVGVVLFLGAFPLLLWNEGNSVHTARMLEEGAAKVVPVSADRVDDTNEGKLIHTTGEATTDETLTDDTFGIVAPKTIKLGRKVEIYQWEQKSQTRKEKQLGGGEKTITTYTHEKKWSDKPIDSSTFHQDEQGNLPVNVGQKTYPDEEKQAKRVTLGAFKLTPHQVQEMGKGKPLTLTEANLTALPPAMKGKNWKLSPKNGSGDESAFYLPYSPDGNPDNPQIGDQRVTFLELKPQDISVLAAQYQGSFQPWHSQAGGKDLDDLRPGIMSAQQMFGALEHENVIFTWVMRLVGYFCMALGIFLVGKPIVVFFDILPFLGSLVSAGLAIIALLLALPLALITIALGWVAYRPMVGIPLLVGGVLILGACLAGLVFVWRKSAKPAAVTLQ